MKKNVKFFIASVLLGFLSFAIVSFMDETIPVSSIFGDLVLYAFILIVGTVNGFMFRDKKVIHKIARIALSLFLIIITFLGTMFFMLTPMSF